MTVDDELEERCKKYLKCSKDELDDLKTQNRQRYNYYQTQLSGILSKEERKAMLAAKAANQHEYDAIVKARSIVRRNEFNQRER